MGGPGSKTSEGSARLPAGATVGASATQVPLQASVGFNATLTPRLVTEEKRRAPMDATQLLGALTTYGFGHLIGTDVLGTPTGGILGGMVAMAWWLRLYSRHLR
jgi:hypothetical protein